MAPALGHGSRLADSAVSLIVRLSAPVTCCEPVVFVLTRSKYLSRTLGCSEPCQLRMSVATGFERL